MYPLEDDGDDADTPDYHRRYSAMTRVSLVSWSIARRVCREKAARADPIRVYGSPFNLSILIIYNH